MTHILLVAPTTIGEQRAGPAIRYWEFARELSRQQPVTLLVPNDDPPAHADFAVQPGSATDWDRLLATHQVIVVQGPALQRYPTLAQTLAEGEHYLVVDLYDPITLEQLEIDRGGERGRWLHREYTALLNEQLLLGDFFLCATERQRDYWLGALSSLGRINPETYDGAQMQNLIGVVPFGLPAELPQRGEPVLKGVLPGIEEDDRLILWGGGLWEWLDPLTPIRAIGYLKNHCPTARLVFFQSPQFESPMIQQARQLAVELGVLGTNVLFANWLPSESWAACLLEADVGLSFHPATIEARFAFRTRLLDYIWARLPIVTAVGDELSALVVSEGLGYAVSPGDAEALADALLALLEEPDPRAARQAAFRQVAARYTWERVVQALASYCRQPWPAPDRATMRDERLAQSRQEHLQSELAHAHRRLAEAQAQISALEMARDEVLTHADGLQVQIETAQQTLAAAMDGRVMRLLTATQRAARRLWGRGR